MKQTTSTSDYGLLLRRAGTKANLPCCSLFIVLMSLANVTAQQTIVEFAAGEHDRFDIPIRFELPQGTSPDERLVLESFESGDKIAVQRLDQDSAIAIISKLKANSSERYELRRATSSSANLSRVVVEDDGKSLKLSVNNKPVLTYNCAIIESPKGIDPKYRRSGHVHPIFDPAGRKVTDDFSPDHAHQHAMFFAWVNTTHNEHGVDFWNQLKGTGDVRHSKKHSANGGEVFGRIEVGQTHFDISETIEGVNDRRKRVPVIDERWEIIVYTIDKHFVIDFTSTQKLIGDSPLTINEYHYGGFALRGNRDWTKPKDADVWTKSDFLTSDGKGRSDGNHSRPKWTSMFGEIEGQTSSITVIDHPDNFRHPQPVRLHPSMPYFCQAPMVQGEFKLTGNAEYKSRYRLIVSAEEPDAEFLDRCSEDFANPPATKTSTAIK